MQPKESFAVLKTEEVLEGKLSANTYSEIICPRCGSNKYIKRGLSPTGKKRYSCKDCNRSFHLNPEWQPLEVSNEWDFNHDIWTAEQLGLVLLPHTKNNKLNFTSIKPQWLKENAKKFILYSSRTKQFSTLLHNYLRGLQSFSRFLSKVNPNNKIFEITRSDIVDFVGDLKSENKSSSYVMGIISTLKLFFETGILNNWFEVRPNLIRIEDYPKPYKFFPRYIPKEVTQQLNQNLDILPESVMRMVLVLQETGIRISELCQLPIDCLKQDSKDQWRLQFMRWKMKNEDTLPISQELAKVIQEQQQYIKFNLGNNFNYLFCARKQGGQGGWKSFRPSPKVMTGDAFANYLKRLAKESNITDSSGKPWNFQTHQFRHTVGTQMINNGVPQHIVQRYLGHESPQMTMVYAHIHDETLRKEIEKYHETQVVNFQGETAELEETVLASGDDLEWFKKTVQARALEHGYCARPKLLGDCDIPGFDGCYNCPHWRTNKNFLPVLKDTLQRTENVLNKARNCGWELQVKKNEPVKTNLEKVIKSLEEAS